MTKIGVIFNPYAGGNKRNPQKRRERLQKILGDHGIVRQTESLEDLKTAAVEFRDNNIEILALSGGDGSNHCALTAFQDVYPELPPVALLRGGTMNLLECSLNMKGNPEQRLKKLVKMVEAEQYRAISHTMLCVNGQFGYIFGNGLVANFLNEYYEGGNPSFKKAVSLFGKAAWAAITGKDYVKNLFAPIKANVYIGQSALPETSFAAIMAATEQECGLGFKPFYRAREEKGKFHLLAATNLKPMEVIQNLSRIHSGKKIQSDNFYDVVTDKVRLETFEPYYYTIDGEMLNSTKTIEISAGPEIKLLAI